MVKTEQCCEHKLTHEQLVKKAKEITPAVGYVNIMCQILKLLGDPTRMKIIYSLLNGEMCVLHIVEAVEGTQSAVSQQLRLLKDNKLVKSRRDGKNILYSIADEHVVDIIKLVEVHAHCELEK